MPSEVRLYVTIDELSAICGLSVATLRRLVRGGRLHAVQPGGRGTKLLFRRDVLETAGPSDPPSTAGPSLRLPGPKPNWKR
jgi:excisionase family DNA binding protein